MVKHCRKEVVFTCPICGKELLVIYEYFHRKKPEDPDIKIIKLECEHCKVVTEDDEEFQDIEILEDKLLDQVDVLGVMHYLVKK